MPRHALIRAVSSEPIASARRSRRPLDQPALEGVVGTPAFMAPEMIVGSGTVDHRADIYALGCVAYFLLTGQQVFQAARRCRALIDHVSTAPRPPSALAPAPIPRALDALVLECLEKDPARRPPDALTVAQRLSECGGAGDWSTTQAALWLSLIHI